MTRRLYGGVLKWMSAIAIGTEVNPDLIERIEAEGLVYVGKTRQANAVKSSS